MTDITALYGNSTISTLGAGLFSNASPSVPLIPQNAPSSFTPMSKIAVPAVGASHSAAVPAVGSSHPAAAAPAAPAVPAPPVAQKVAAPQAVVSVPVHSTPGEYTMFLDPHVFTLNIAAPSQAISAPAPITQYNEWMTNIIVEVSVQFMEFPLRLTNVL
jgi:hypothetical protein